jgi:hypothetical protein
MLFAVCLVTLAALTAILGLVYTVLDFLLY